MALHDEVKESTENDTIMWCKKQVQSEDLFYSKIPNGHLVFIPSTNTLKVWAPKTGDVFAEVYDLSVEIVDNVSRHTDLAVETKDR